MRRSLASLLIAALVMSVATGAEAAIAIPRDLLELLDANDPATGGIAVLDDLIASGRLPVGGLGGVRVVVCDGIASDAALSAGANAWLAMATRSAGNSATVNLGLHGGLVGDLTGAVYTGGHSSTVDVISTAGILTSSGNIELSDVTLSGQILSQSTTSATEVNSSLVSNVSGFSSVFKGDAFGTWTAGCVDLNVAHVDAEPDVVFSGVLTRLEPEGDAAFDAGVEVDCETDVPLNLRPYNPEVNSITGSMLLGSSDSIDLSQLRIVGPVAVGDLRVQGSELVTVPEPGTLMLLTVGLLALAAVGRLSKR